MQCYCLQRMNGYEKFFKTSFGRIFGYAENRALRGFRRTAWPTALRRGRSAPLQSLAQVAHQQAGVSLLLGVKGFHGVRGCPRQMKMKGKLRILDFPA
jgi:hypothetical protein